MLSFGQRKTLVSERRLMMIIQDISSEAAMLRFLECHISGGRSRIMAMKERVPRATAAG